MRLHPLFCLLFALCCSHARGQEPGAAAPETAVGTLSVAAESAQTETEEVQTTAEEDAAEPSAAETEDSVTPAAEEPEPAPAAAEDESAPAESIAPRMTALAALLARVQDAASAAALSEEVREGFTALVQSDVLSELSEEADEEEAAAAFAELFAPVDAQLARLEEADFYGVAALRAVFVEGTEGDPESGAAEVVFPVGGLDFLRGTRGAERHVCPREETPAMPLFDWNAED